MDTKDSFKFKLILNIQGKIITMLFPFSEDVNKLQKKNEK